MRSLRVSQLFGSTVQGEGKFVGAPAVFLRLTGCTLNCSFCDTKQIWTQGEEWTIDELLQRMVQDNLVNELAQGSHLVLTGGSPLLQQEELVALIEEFIRQFGFKPFIEIENEAVIYPIDSLLVYVDAWNNSPKLSNSGMPKQKRIRPNVLSLLDSFVSETSFKFVVKDFSDWKEIVRDFIEPGYISKENIWLMPMAANRKELNTLEVSIAHLAYSVGVHYSTRLHIQLWNINPQK